MTFFCLVIFIVVSASAQITVSSSNNVGIKTSTPNEALEVNGNIRGNLNGGALQINTASNGYLQLGPQEIKQNKKLEELLAYLIKAIVFRGPSVAALM